jgi:DNA-binding transcriptional LysR family regulator
MDPRKLLYLASVIEQGSFKKAATHLLISQPALSTSMDRLEASLGVKLLERGPTGVTPTPFGELIYSHARLIRDEIDLAVKQIQPSDENGRHVITFGTLPSLASSVVPLALCKWRQSHPKPLLRVVEKVQVELLIGLLRRELDFIIGMTECYDYLDGLRQRVLFRDRLCVFARPDHPVFRMPQISWAALAEFPWACPLVGRQNTILENLLRAEGVAMPRQITEYGSVTFLKTLVSGSDHLAMLPIHAIKPDIVDGRLKPLSITVSQLNRNIAVYFRESSSLDEASRDLVASVEAVGADVCREQPYGITKEASLQI